LSARPSAIRRTVATLVDRPAASPERPTPLTADQVRDFLAGTAGDRLGPLYGTAIATGCRQGELLGLRWQDMDLDTGTLTVAHTLERGTRELAEPKTERSRRTLRLGAGTVAILRTHKARQAAERLAAGRKWQDKDYVFATGIGTPLESRNVTHALQAALARLGLPRQRFHDLRHAYATLMLEEGEDVAIVSKNLGHSTVRTTTDTYAHLTAKMRVRSAARMDALLTRRSG
jgi:integrase